MALEDIVLGVKFDTSEMTPAMNAVHKGISMMREQIVGAIEDFNRFESMATSMGTTMEALTGVSSDAAQAYRELSAASAQLDMSMRAIRIEAIAPAANELKELASGAGDAVGALQDLFRQFTTMRDSGFRTGFATLFGGMDAPVEDFSYFTNFAAGTWDSIKHGVGKFFGGHAYRRVSNSQMEERIKRENQLNAMDKISEESRAQEILEARQEAYSSAFEGFGDRMQGSIDSFRVSRRNRVLNRAMFDRSQSIDRRAFEESQDVAVMDRGMLPMEEALRRQRVAMQQFDIRQRAATEKQDMRDQINTGRAMLQVQENTRKNLDRLQDVINAINDQTKELMEERNVSSETLEDIQ